MAYSDLMFNEVPINARDPYLWNLMCSTTTFDREDWDWQRHDTNKFCIVIYQEVLWIVCSLCKQGYLCVFKSICIFKSFLALFPLVHSI